MLALKMTIPAVCLLLLAARPLPAQQVIPGTATLVRKDDLALEMVEGIHRYLDRETAQAAEKRSPYWHRDYSTIEAYVRSVEPNRAHLRQMIGAVDPRPVVSSLDLDATTTTPALIAEASGYRVYAVRWPALDGVRAEGLLLEPSAPPVARAVALPDADWTPEMLAGLAPGLPPAAQFARRLAENGCLVVIPALINRKDTWSGIPGIRMTNQPHREFLYRMSFQVGRHIIGYEVQETLALVDWSARGNAKHRAPVMVAGYGEGGLVAFYSAALDTRVDAALVSGYFQPREHLWNEPVYRDVWGLTREFGDADIASLIAPRRLVIEASPHPRVDGPPPPSPDRRGATPNGRLATPPFAAVEAEAGRARRHFAALGRADSLRLETASQPGSDAALRALLGKGALRAPGSPHRPASGLRPATQTEETVRRAGGIHAAGGGALPVPARGLPTIPGRARSRLERNDRPPAQPLPARQCANPPRLRRTEVSRLRGDARRMAGCLRLWNPAGSQNLQPGERRPVVVCQHGLEGRAQDAADPKIDSPYYHRFAVQLAEQGFVTYSPQNPYIGQDRFRLIQRKAHPLKLSLFSFILGQHQRTLEWLSSLPFIDPKRIGFYGLSYGGKTAMRVPPLLTGYALSICSADFNEWVWKTTSVTSPYSYMLTQEYDMLEWNLANTVNYSELASLMAPRPFMVERGHDDGVAPDEWVAYEFAKVRRFYDKAGLGGKARIEFFNGPHTIHGVGTFEFLKKHLDWTGR